MDRLLHHVTTAVSLLDRLLHHATTVVTSGKSYRMRDLRMSDSFGEEPTGGETTGANISDITERVWTGKTCPGTAAKEAMLADLVEIQKAGVTTILDNRIEWSDEEFVRTHAQHLGFLWNGADDVGQVMPDDSFDAGVEFALAALEDPDAQVLAHCHIGINRGPSMAFAILLAKGMDPIAALIAIRRADRSPRSTTPKAPSTGGTEGLARPWRW